MKMMERGQITILKEFRDLYGIKAGSDLNIRPVEESLLPVKKNFGKSPFWEVFGILEKHITSDSVIHKLLDSLFYLIPYDNGLFQFVS